MIWVTTEKEGFHFWKNAPKEVGFLKHPHRHIFKFKVYISTFHNDRELEFFIFKDFIDNCINFIWIQQGLNYWNKCDEISCEMISDDLSKMITKKYTKRNIIIEVSEDGEDGSYSEYEFFNKS